MANFPFQLSIKRSFEKKRNESLTCTALLRVVPGSRDVYDALWNDRAVIVKVFSHKTRAKRHLRREWRGLSLLQKRGLSSPEPLFYGQTEDGRWAVVVEKIVDSSTILDAINDTNDTTRKLDLLVLACKKLAKQHSKAVLQKDLHLGNFLLQGDKIFALDPAQMRFLSHQVTRKRSISQLALLACSLPAGDTESIAGLCKEYFNARGWRLSESDMELFRKQLTVHRKRGVRNGLKKSLRTSKRYLRILATKAPRHEFSPPRPKGTKFFLSLIPTSFLRDFVTSWLLDRHIAMFDRGFCLGAEPLDFIEQIDALMNGGEILKNGRTSYVSRITWNGKDVVVKRYNYRGFIHSLRHTIKRSRARRCWLHAHRLEMLNIPTPRPLAYIEQYKGRLIWNSYIITEYVEGRMLYDFLRDGVTEEKRSKTIKQVSELLERLGKHRITHGDLKHSNILITDNGPVLTDLDGMIVHRWGPLYRNKRAKDLARFEKRYLSKEPVTMLPNMKLDHINFYKREERIKYMLKNFREYLGNKVLDIGCDKRLLKTFLPDLDYTGVDISGTPDVYLDLEAVERLPFDDCSFDCVVCADVLEHLDNLHLIFSELLRVSSRYVIIAWPNNWVNARVPIEQGFGSFKHYGLPVEKPPDRHKWFFNLSDVRYFVREHIRKNDNIRLVEERICEKPRVFVLHWLRCLRYPNQEWYLNRYAHTIWTILQKTCKYSAKE